VEMLTRMWWAIEADYDFGYIVASSDGENWDVLAGDFATTHDPVGASFGPGYTGRSADLSDEDGGWLVERIDLSAYVGEIVWVRFEYVTDDAINTAGWFIDEVQIPALDYHTDFSHDDGGWQSEGWLLTDNLLEQRWLVQVLHLEDNRLVDLERYHADAEGRIVAPIAALGNGRTAVIAISPTTPVTTVPAPYSYHIERGDEVGNQ
jgi:immune inhibitor A